MKQIEELQKKHQQEIDEMEKKREELDLKEDEIEVVREQAAAIGADLISEGVSKEEATDLVSDAENMFGAPSVVSTSFNAAAKDGPVEPSSEIEPQEPQPLTDDGPVVQPM